VGARDGQQPSVDVLDQVAELQDEALTGGIVVEMCRFGDLRADMVEALLAIAGRRGAGGAGGGTSPARAHRSDAGPAGGGGQVGGAQLASSAMAG
jgi:hypothetical protein